MPYLDVNPMMVSLRTTPEDFDMRGGWLRHTPSRHSFKFEPTGRVQIRAECNCAFLMIRPEQERSLAESFEQWRTNYWRPLEINREFASHFRPRSRIRRALLAMTARLNGWLLGQHDEDFPIKTGVAAD